MSLVSGFNPGQVSGERQSYGSESLGNGGSLLLQLEDRVSQTLAEKNNPLGGGGVEMGNLVNPQDVVSYMAQISDQPIAGMQLSSVV
jgi:hypothetical protein